MSKEELTEVTEEGTEEVGVEEYSGIEQEAISHGWNPDGVEGRRNLTAEEFMDRQPLYDDIKYLKKENRKLKEGVDALRATTKVIREQTKSQVIAELKAQKRQALEEEKFDEVMEIDDKIAEANAAPTDDGPVDNSAFENWVDHNEWYAQNLDMKEYADTIGFAYFQRNPNKSQDEVFRYVEKAVKRQYPDEFGEEGRPAKRKPAPVEGATRGRGNSGKKRYSARDLDDQSRAIMNTTIKSGAMSEQEWLEAYFSD